MHNLDYHEMPCISSHWLIEMLKSPADCYRRYLDPLRTRQESTPSMNFGTLIHCLALTPKLLDREFIVADYERRSNAGKAHYADLVATGLHVIKPTELEKARTIVANLKAHPDSRNLLRHGKPEQTLIKQRGDGLLPLKGRIDLHREAYRQVVELKTTWNMARIEQTMLQYHYPLSAAFYQALTHSLSVAFIFVQTSEPYEVAVFEMLRLHLQEGREQFHTALQRFDECWKANHWPEAEPTPDIDDDPLMMNFMPMNPNRQRFDLPCGELAL